jgi:hypothetical protein
MSAERKSTFSVSPKDPDSRWVALSSENIIISEGKNPTQVLKEAKEKSSENVFMMFVPKKGTTYIF